MTQSILPETVFKSILRDASTQQPDIITNSSQKNELIWTLSNNQDEDLVINPFSNKKVDKDHYHFLFFFEPGTLKEEPTLHDWKTAIEKDNNGTITKLYLALKGKKAVEIEPGKDFISHLCYTEAIQEDRNNSEVSVTIEAGKNVTLDGNSIEGKSLGPVYLTLVKASPAVQFTSPISVDFVGRLTVLNDGETPNSFTFAITNMMQTDLELYSQDNPKGASPTTITVWFDAAPNNPQKTYPEALAKIEYLVSEDVNINMPDDEYWQHSRATAEAKAEGIWGNPRWKITLKKSVKLKPQKPVMFTFSGIKTDLDPGFTRMYLKYENLPGFHDGILICELEKTPMLYGSKRGQGVYISSGKYEGDTPPEPQYNSVLNVRSLGNKPVATFYRGNNENDGELELTSSDQGWNFNIKADTEEKKHIGIGTTDPKERVEIAGYEGKGGRAIVSDGQGKKRKVILINAPGKEKNYGRILAYKYGDPEGGKNLVLQDMGGNVGIGEKEPEEKLDVKGAIKAQGLRVNSEKGIRLSSKKCIVLSLKEHGGGQLALKNNKNDNQIFLEGYSKDYKSSAEAIHISGMNGKNIPSLNLQAHETKIAGKVGIGTTEASAKLDVNKSGNNEDTISLQLRNGNNSDSSKRTQITFSWDGKQQYRHAIFSRHNADGNNGNALDFYVWKHGNDKSAIGGLHTMTLNGGNVGIGTKKPNENIEIADSNGARAIVSDGNGDNRRAILFQAPSEKKDYGRIVAYKYGDKKGGRDLVLQDTGGNVKIKNNLIIEGATYCKGPLKYYWNPDGAWKHIENRGGNWAGSYTTNGPSDMRFKEDINQIQNALNKVSQLNGVFHRWNDKGLEHFAKDIESTFSAGPEATKAEHEEVWQAEREKLHEKLSKTYASVIAQEVEAVLPEAVTEGEDGYKSVQYHSLIPLLIEAVKEQSEVVDRQREDIEQLKSAQDKADQELENVKAKVSKLEAVVQDLIKGRETSL